MSNLLDIYGAPIKSGFYKDPRQNSVHYFDLENLKIIRADNIEIEMTALRCREFAPLKDPLKFAQNYRNVANFIASKLEYLSKNLTENKANLSEEEINKENDNFMGGL